MLFPRSHIEVIGPGDLGASMQKALRDLINGWATLIAPRGEGGGSLGAIRPLEAL